MYSGSFANSTLGKAAQLAKDFGTGHNPPIFVDRALELDLEQDAKKDENRRAMVEFLRGLLR